MYTHAYVKNSPFAQVFTRCCTWWSMTPFWCLLRFGPFLVCDLPDSLITPTFRQLHLQCKLLRKKLKRPEWPRQRVKQPGSRCPIATMPLKSHLWRFVFFSRISHSDLLLLTSQILLSSFLRCISRWASHTWHVWGIPKSSWTQSRFPTNHTSYTKRKVVTGLTDQVWSRWRVAPRNWKFWTKMNQVNQVKKKNSERRSNANEQTSETQAKPYHEAQLRDRKLAADYQLEAQAGCSDICSGGRYRANCLFL